MKEFEWKKWSGGIGAGGLRAGMSVGIRGGFAVVGLGFVGLLSLGAGDVLAACTAAPSCAALGYTSTTCSDGGVKCPWDTSKMFCKGGEAVCNYTITAAQCTNNCQDVGGSACTKNGTAYYSSCGASRCSSDKTCSGGSCVCPSKYQYPSSLCYSNGGNGTIGSGCDGKYENCSCSNRDYVWIGSKCGCDSEYKFACNRRVEYPIGMGCDGKYDKCGCSHGFYWNGSACEFTFSCPNRCGPIGEASGGSYCPTLEMCRDKAYPQLINCMQNGTANYRCISNY